MALRNALNGQTGYEASASIGPNVLTAKVGLCVPFDQTREIIGVNAQNCDGRFYHGEEIDDSGAGGPLRNAPGQVYGLVEAVALSSTSTKTSRMRS